MGIAKKHYSGYNHYDGGGTMTVTFCGHSHVSDAADLSVWQDKVLNLLVSEGADRFYLGGYGDFDRMAAEAVKAKKAEKPDIEMALVTAYLSRQADGEFYDYMIYPTLKDVTQRSAIPKRNEWMVDSADVVVAYVTHEWGGAAKTLEYARRCGKRVILYPELSGRW